MADSESSKQTNLTLCTDGANRTAEDYKETYIHELMHAFDHCQKNKKEFSCDEKICSELKAYSEDGSCMPGGSYRLQGETERECIERGTLNSVLGQGKCSKKRKDSLQTTITSKFGYCVSREVRNRTNQDK